MFQKSSSSELTDPNKALVNAICKRDIDEVQNLLDKNSDFNFKSTIFHLLCNSEKQTCVDECPNKEETIIYMLIDHGFDTEVVDENGNTCLFYAVQNSHSNLCQVLLQCGANMWANTQFNISIFQYVLQISPVHIKNIFEKFYPGIWKAIEKEDIYQVRKLVNLWCRTEICKDGLSLKDIALKTGHEEIISLILGIFDTMKLIYHIFAKNIKSIREILEKKHSTLRLNLRKMSDRGAPILYYLIKSSDIRVIELFIKYRCPLYTIMQDELGYDMPVFFSALKSDISLEVMQALLPSGMLYQEEMLFKILYKGKTILEVALAQNVKEDVFSLLIDRGGPLLLCDRNQANQTIRDIAIIHNNTKYIDVIDKVVFSWILNPQKYPNRRQKLALYGWDLETLMKEFSKERNDNDYLIYVQKLQKGIEHLVTAVENDDVENYFHLKAELSQIETPENFLWHAKLIDDGMPLLHRAVIHNNLEIVQDILLEKPEKESIDNLFDQNRRTALHYAYASSSMKAIRTLLMSYGCSEHVLDKVNREPLDFRCKQDTPAMLQLLNRLKLKHYQQPECDPWTIENCEKELASVSEDDFQYSDDDDEEEEYKSYCLIS